MADDWERTFSESEAKAYQTGNRRRLEAQTDELRACVQKTLADAERILTSPRICMANAMDGRRDRTRNAVDASDEPYFHTDPCSLLAGRHEPYTDRREPETRKYEAARWADKSRTTGQGLAAGPRRGRDDFYAFMSIKFYYLLLLILR